MAGDRGQQDAAQIRRGIEARLVPRGAIDTYRLTRRGDTESSICRYGIYRLLSLISSAIRDRAADHRRSATRSDTPSRSAVSAVENPAK